MTTRINILTGTGGARINSDRIGLPSKVEREELYQTFRRLYDGGTSDTPAPVRAERSDLEIAELAGSCDRTVRRWRFRNNLPNIYGKLPTYGG